MYNFMIIFIAIIILALIYLVYKVKTFKPTFFIKEKECYIKKNINDEIIGKTKSYVIGKRKNPFSCVYYNFTRKDSVNSYWFDVTEYNNYRAATTFTSMESAQSKLNDIKTNPNKYIL